jgi:hypothetical protein
MREKRNSEKKQAKQQQKDVEKSYASLFSAYFCVCLFHILNKNEEKNILS